MSRLRKPKKIPREKGVVTNPSWFYKAECVVLNCDMGEVVIASNCRYSISEASSMIAPELELNIDEAQEVAIFKSDSASAQQSGWISVDGAKNLPLGNWQVATEGREGREPAVHIANALENVVLVGGYFHFDMPKVYAYAPCLELPTPPKGE